MMIVAFEKEMVKEDTQRSVTSIECFADRTLRIQLVPMDFCASWI